MDEFTMRDYLRVIFGRKAVILFSFIIVMATVTAGLMLKTPAYQAQVKMLISAQKLVESPYYRELLGYQNVQIALTQSEIVRSNPVIERTVKALNLDQRPLGYEKSFCSPLKGFLIDLRTKFINTKLLRLASEQRQAYLYRMAVDDLKKCIDVEPVRDTYIFTIIVKDFSPAESAVIANVISRSYVIFDLEQQLAEIRMQYGEKHLTVMQLEDNIMKIKQSLSGEPMPDIEAIGPASVKIIEQATLPLEPAGIPKALTLVLAFFMALLISIMLAFAFEYMDHSFKSPRAIEKILNIPYLGSVPRKATLESFRILTNQLCLVLKDKDLKTVLFFSALPEEGVTNTVANLAVYMSKTGRRKTLVIDANLRAPGIFKNLGLPESGGLAEVLEGGLSFDNAVRDAGENLQVITAGKTSLNPVTLLNSNAMKSVLKTAKDRYEIVLVDSPSLREYTDAVILSTCVDACCLVVTEGKTRKQVVQSAIAPLQHNKAVIIGAILNNRSFVLPKILYDRT